MAQNPQASRVYVVNGDNNPIATAQTGKQSVANSSTTPLTGGATFTGAGEFTGCSDVMVSCFADAAGTLYLDFSPDGTNWGAFPTNGFVLTASVHEFHIARKGPRYFRVRLVNGSAAQSILRLYCYCGTFGNTNAPINQALSEDSDAQIVRSIGEESMIAEGRWSGRSVVHKFGRNSDVDTGSVPEDVWNGGGVYTGFPTGAPEEIQAFSSDAADTGTLTFTYLASSTSTAYQTASVVLQGTTPVNTGVTVYRMHTARYSSGAATTFNAGEITMRHRVTTANIFCVMPIGRSQTNVSAYTVPAGFTGHLRRLFCRVLTNTSASVSGALWVRDLNGSPRLRRPFASANSDYFEESPYGGITINAGADIAVRITSASANNTDVIAGFDLILVAN
jgi:hypothetical protein